jgi:hypothetical protein
VPEDNDLTTIPDDAEYAPGELLVRFAPKAKGIQYSTEEKNQIMSFLGEATVKENYRIVPGLSVVKLPAGVMVDAVTKLNKIQGIIYAELGVG